MSGYCEQCGETICVCDAKVAELKAENEALREKLAKAEQLGIQIGRDEKQKKYAEMEPVKYQLRYGAAEGMFSCRALIIRPPKPTEGETK